MTHAPGRETLPPRPRSIVRATDLGAVRVLKHGSLFALCDAFGDVRPDTRGLGIYDGDTRVLSCAALRVDGQRPVVLRSDDGGAWRAVVELTNGDLRETPQTEPSAEPRPRRESIGITRERWLAGAAFHERITVANFALIPYQVTVELELDADFADIFEVRGAHRDERGELLPIEVGPERVVFGYRGIAGIETRTTVEFSEPAAIRSVADGADGRLVASWSWPLSGGARRHLEWSASVGFAGTYEPTGAMPARMSEIVAEALRVQAGHPAVDPTADHAAWWGDGARIDADNELVELTLERGIRDLRLLVNDGPGEGQWYLSAGVPWFATLFGRDSLVTSLQTLPFYPAIAIATLEALASLQSESDDPWRDAEPGKIAHELRTGELARAGVLPFSPYYGTADATPLWLVLLAETCAWTGDLELARRLWPNALRALEWIDRYGDHDGDGFVEYERRSPVGLRNQGWKDSRDSIRDRFGRLAEGAIALAEVQGYVHAAKRGIARLARLLGDEALATRLEGEATALAARFEARFWLADLGRYAMALDGAKRPVDALGSVGGHLLWSGIAAPEHAAQVEEQLLGPALFNGWGVRTLAADAAGYNPLGYHIGTVWPHDTAIAAAGLKAYGRHDGATRLAQALLESAQFFPGYRLPELFCGFDRAATMVPVAYPTACSPQAWAAGAPFLLLRTLLGLEARSDERELRILHPTLPPWIRRLTIHDLRVGDASVDLLFHRWRGMTAAELLSRTGDLTVSVRL
jgi:glycogen debranching enzyme